MKKYNEKCPAVFIKYKKNMFRMCNNIHLYTLPVGLNWVLYCLTDTEGPVNNL
jgi:hypothetical protein